MCQVFMSFLNIFILKLFMTVILKLKKSKYISEICWISERKKKRSQMYAGILLIDYKNYSLDIWIKLIVQNSMLNIYIYNAIYHFILYTKLTLHNKNELTRCIQSKEKYSYTLFNYWRIFSCSTSIPANILFFKFIYDMHNSIIG